MTVEQSRFAKLMELAKETSSEKRRDMLREVTDIFFEKESDRSDSESQMFDEIIVAVANDMTDEVRRELAAKVARAKTPLRRTARRLATDSITVARPVLQHSSILSDEDLVEIVKSKPQDHLMAVSKRQNIAEVVSAALVEKGEDPVVASLLENETAKINRVTFETITERAKTSELLQAPLVKRKTVPLDLLHEMYSVVEQQLRQHVMARFDSVSEAELADALKKSRSRINVAYGGQPADLDDAKAWLRQVTDSKRLNPPMLVQLLRDSKKTHFLCALSYLTDMPFNVVHRITGEKDIDALAILCRSANFEKPLFTSIAVIIIGGENGVAQANKFAEMYTQVPPAAAQRAVRFWKVRSTTANTPKSNAA